MEITKINTQNNSLISVLTNNGNLKGTYVLISWLI